MMASYFRNAQGLNTAVQAVSLKRAGSVCAVVLVTAMSSVVAKAGEGDTLTPFVSASYSYDDNLFRLSDAVAGGLLSDRSKSVVAGVNFSRPVGRQAFTASAKVTKVTYDRYEQLNYNGKDFSGLWRWRLGNDFDGNIGATYLQSLTSFNDYGSRERNLHLQRSQFADGGWRFLPHWRLRTRLSKDKSEYDLLSRQFLDRSDDATEFGLDYLASTRSTIGLQVRRIKGDYTHPLVLGPLSYDQSYTQDDVKLKILWNYDAITQIQFLGGRARRSHQQLTNRDASGTNARLTAFWQFSPALRFNGALYREFTPFEGGGFSYSLNTGGSLGAQWAPTDRLLLDTELRKVKRNFSGLRIGTNIVGAPDDSRTQTMSLNYLFRDKLQIGVSVFHDVREGVSGFTNSYRAKGATLSATAQF